MIHLDKDRDMSLMTVRHNYVRFKRNQSFYKLIMVLLVAYFLIKLFIFIIRVFDTPDSIYGSFEVDATDNDTYEWLPTFLRNIQPSSSHHNIYQILTTDPSLLKYRQFCSLESYCLKNPESFVWMLFLATRYRSIIGAKSLHILRLLMERYPNLRLATMNMALTLQGTPLQNLLSSGRLRESTYIYHHLSDTLRLALVYKAGGLYTDFDFINLKSVENLHNFLALAVPERTCNGIFHFDAGHSYLQHVMLELNRTYDGTKFSVNGPMLLSRCAKDLCPQFDFLMDGQKSTLQYILDYFRRIFGIEKEIGPCNPAANRSVDNCDGLTIRGLQDFLPVNWKESDSLFESNSAIHLSETIQDSYSVHLFNKLTSHLPIITGTNASVAGRLMVHNCPVVHEAAGKYMQQMCGAGNWIYRLFNSHRETDSECLIET